MSDTSTCASVELRLPAYLAGDLPEAERAAVQAHLAGCPACRELADSLHLLSGAMTMTPLPETLDPARHIQIREAFRRRAERPAFGRRLAAFFEFLNPARPPAPGLRFAVALIVFIAVPLLMMALLLPATLVKKKPMHMADGLDYESSIADVTLPPVMPPTPAPVQRGEGLDGSEHLTGESNSELFTVPAFDDTAGGRVTVANGLISPSEPVANGAVDLTGWADTTPVSDHDGKAVDRLAGVGGRGEVAKSGSKITLRDRDETDGHHFFTTGTIPVPEFSRQEVTALRVVGGAGRQISNAKEGGRRRGDKDARDVVAPAKPASRPASVPPALPASSLPHDALAAAGGLSAELTAEKQDEAKPALVAGLAAASDFSSLNVEDASGPLVMKGLFDGRSAADRGLAYGYQGGEAKREDLPAAASAPEPVQSRVERMVTPVIASLGAPQDARNQVLNGGEVGYVQVDPSDPIKLAAKSELSESKTARTYQDRSRMREDEAAAASAAPPRNAPVGMEAGEEFVTMDAASTRTAAPVRKARVAPASELEKKLANTIIPLVDFRQANLSDVMKFLEESVAQASPDGKPVTIDAQAVTTPPGQKELGNDSGDLFGAPAETPSITLSLRNVSALNALKYVTEVASTKFRMEGDKVVVEPEGVVQGRVVTRLYPVQPAFMDAITGKAAGAEASDDGVKAFLEDAGIPFPVGTSVSYNPEIGQLVVANTPENLEAFENTLANLDVVTNVPPREPAAFNPYVETRADAFSTFSIDVDTASYTLTRRALSEGRLPEPEEVRTEEVVNAFDYDYAPPTAGAFAMDAVLAPSPFRAPLELLKIGVQGRALGRDAKKAAVLTLVIDASGSMDTPDRLGRIRRALRLLADQLKPNDSVAIVAFNNTARLLLDRTAAANKESIVAAIDSLAGSGSTQLEGGLQLAYEVAARGFVSGGANRVILMSDGVANLGAATAAEILQRIEQYRQQGIYLTVLGFGSGNYDDAMLLQLADKGDGMYAYVDSDEEAHRLLVDQWEQTLHVIAKDAKIQVEFNPDRVRRWRQIGYEKRHLNKEDFRNDKIDAGEVGSGQAVTALYDVELAGDPALPVATVRVRYQDPDTGRVTELEQRITSAHRQAGFQDAPPRFQVAACAAEFAELLRASPYTAGTDFGAVADALRPAALALPLDQRVQELLRLVEAARGLAE